MSAVGQRRALRQQGGPVRTQGDQARASLLEAALLGAAGTPDDELTHGFHSYPARMHPAIARAVIGALPDAESVLDPFCGSGTVLVEAMVAGRKSTGVDLNPVGCRVAQVRCELRGADARRRFVEAAHKVSEASQQRTRKRQRARIVVPQRIRNAWAPHTLAELSGLREEIDRVRPVSDRNALLAVLSAIVVKFSVRAGDTSQGSTTKNIGKGIPSRFYARKATELAQRWAALAAASPRDAKRPRVIEGDMRDEPWGRRVSLVLTSPPYGGTYDYLQHHELRYAWLGVSPRALRANEFGARRNLSRGRDAAARWDDDVAAALDAMAGAMRRDADAILLWGDAQAGRKRVAVDEQLARLAPDHGLTLVASASAERRDHLGGPPRWEHLLWLRPG